MHIESDLHTPHGGPHGEILGSRQNQAYLASEEASEERADSLQVSQNARLLLSGEDFGTADSLPGQGEAPLGRDLTRSLSDRSVSCPICGGSHHLSTHSGEVVSNGKSASDARLTSVSAEAPAEPDASSPPEAGDSAAILDGAPKNAEGEENSTEMVGPNLTEDQQSEVDRLEKRDREVRAHEQAHVGAGGQYVRGGGPVRLRDRAQWKTVRGRGGSLDQHIAGFVGSERNDSKSSGDSSSRAGTVGALGPGS